MSERLIAGEFPSFRQLQVFEAVARHENVSRAAIDANMSQPAVTQAVMKVEAWVGRKLFERSSTGTFLLSEGRRFHASVERLFDQVEAALCRDLFAGRPAAAVAKVVGRLKTSHVNVLAAMSENISFDAAVQRLGLSRSTVWRTARELEHILDGSLYQRGAGGLAVRASVRDLASSLAEACREFEGDVGAIADAAPSRHRLFIGAQKLAHSSLVASTINDVLRAYPDTVVNVIEGSYRGLLHELRGGHVDLIFGPLEKPAWISDVVEEPLIHDPYCVAGRQDHPLCHAGTITREELAALGWVLPGGKSQRDRAFAEMFRDAAHRPRSCITVNAVSTQISILESSDRVTLLPRFELVLENQFSGLVALPFPEQIARIPDGITTRADGAENPAVTCFRSELKRRLDQLGLLLRSPQEAQAPGPRRSRRPRLQEALASPAYR